MVRRRLKVEQSFTNSLWRTLISHLQCWYWNKTKQSLLWSRWPSHQENSCFYALCTSLQSGSAHTLCPCGSYCLLPLHPADSFPSASLPVDYNPESHFMGCYRHSSLLSLCLIPHNDTLHGVRNVSHNCCHNVWLRVWSALWSMCVFIGPGIHLIFV